MTDDHVIEEAFALARSGRYCTNAQILAQLEAALGRAVDPIFAGARISRELIAARRDARRKRRRLSRGGRTA